jgi:hypothetical protein
MSKEQEKLVGDAYNNYGKRMVDIMNVVIPAEFKDKGWVKLKLDYQGKYDVLSQEEFINKCKTDPEFSEKWGLKIEERELSLDERYKIALPIWKEKYGLLANMMVPTNVDNTPYKIPTKLITITYNDKTIESYE